MTARAERWRQARALFDQIVDEPEAQWTQLVRRAAGDDEALSDDVMRLLDASRTNRFALDEPRFALGDPPDEERVGQIIARYRLVRLVGSGGMGAVYEGVRADGAYEQRVAVKLVRPQLGTAGTAARFRRERQFLAGLEHPHIARLLDGGTTDAGEPFFVMEFVEGTPITTYCDERRASIRERLELFVQVCTAVQHAHSRLIVHRDLKPANILVRADSGVKLLDFGVAQLLGTSFATDANDAGDADDAGVAPERRPLTPEYASAEQLRGEPASVASDVYSLGVVLYELLAGRRPTQPRGRSPDAALRALTTGIPLPSVEATPESAAHAGEPNAVRHRHRLAGDLDAITTKTLHADPATRYASVDRLADDVRRYLDGRPVSAHAGSAVYRARKFVRRHWRGATAVTIALVALVGGAAATMNQARRAERERAKAAHIDAFLQDMLSAPDTRWFQSPTHRTAQVTVLDVLDDAARRAGADLAPMPDVEAAVRRTLGQTYQLMERRDAAYAQLTRALELDRRLGVPAVPDLVSDLRDLGLAQLARGELRAADTLFRSALALCRTHGERADTAHVCAHSLNHLGLTQLQEDDVAGAEQTMRQTLAIAQQAFGAAHPVTAIVLAELGDVRAAAGDLTGAERLYRESLAIFAKGDGREYGERMIALGGLSLVLEDEGRLTEIDTLLVDEMGVVTRAEGPQHPDVGLVLVHRGAIDRRLGNLARARDETTRGLAILDADYGPAQRYYTRIKMYEGLLDLADGHLADADRVLTQTLAIAASKYGVTDPRRAEVEDALGQVRLALGRRSEARALFASSAATFTRRFGARHPATIAATQHLVDAAAVQAPRAKGGKT